MSVVRCVRIANPLNTEVILGILDFLIFEGLSVTVGSLANMKREIELLALAVLIFWTPSYTFFLLSLPRTPARASTKTGAKASKSKSTSKSKSSSSSSSS